MKKVDAHIHFRLDAEHFERLAKQSGYENTLESLQSAYEAEGVGHAVVMSNITREPDQNHFPSFMSYCAGIDREAIQPENLDRCIELTEQHLRNKTCVGLKIYAGYTRYDLTYPGYTPYYELAETYNKPVAVHTGVTAHPNALLRYSHPMQLDEVAVNYPKVSFVMCHYGNPWLMDAAAVVEKNHNVTVDISGLLIGRINVEEYVKRHSGYVEQLRTWIDYVDNYEKFMFGTDWPLVNIGDYIRLFEYIIPEQHHDKFFGDNARRIYSLSD